MAYKGPKNTQKASTNSGSQTRSNAASNPNHTSSNARPKSSSANSGAQSLYKGPKKPARSRVNAPKASPARRAALEVGQIVRLRNAFAQEVIAKHVDGSHLTPEDRAFATRLALGVASSLGTLDEVIDRCLKASTDIQSDVRDALRISTYEILFLDKTPHAAVDQGVELVRTVTPKAAGLANAVLRKIVAAKNDFPFGDPATDVSALARAHAFPKWLAERLVSDLGFEDAADFMAASNEPAPVFIAINSLKATSEDVYPVFKNAGSVLSAVVIKQHTVPNCFFLSDTRALQDEGVQRLFREGKILVSDASSQMIARSILPSKEFPKSFLEIGAGRATKTILLQSDAKLLYGKQFKLSTLDNHEFKTKLLKERATRYGVSLEKAYTGDATKLDDVVPGIMFDEIFIDAPCSGLGTLRRHSEIRWRIDEQSVTSLATLGLSMLKSAASHVAPGGTLAYATCTVLREENEDVVKSFLTSAEGANFDLGTICDAPTFHTKLAPRSYDAHFAVCLVRTR